MLSKEEECMLFLDCSSLFSSLLHCGAHKLVLRTFWTSSCVYHNYNKASMLHVYVSAPVQIALCPTWLFIMCGSVKNQYTALYCESVYSKSYSANSVLCD